MQWIKTSGRLPDTPYASGKIKSSKVLLGMRFVDDESVPRLVRFINNGYLGGYYWIDDCTEEIITVLHWAIVTPPTEGE